VTRRRPKTPTSPFSSRVATAIAVVATLAATTPAVAHSEEDVERARNDRDAAYSSVQQAQADLEEALETYDRIHTQLDDVEYRVSKTETILSNYKEEAQTLSEQARRSLVEAYTSTGLSPLGVQLNATGIQDLVMVDYIGARIQERQLADLNRLSSTRSRIETLAEDLDGALQTLSQLESEASNATEQVQARLDDAEHQLEDAERDFEGIRAAFEAEQKQQREAELARTRASTNAATRGLPPSATEGFQCPVQGGAAFIDSWGFPRSGGRTHKGVDMFAQRGTPTPAVTSGTVKMRTVNLGGVVAYLYGDDGNKYYYAHLNGYPDGLRNGQRVERGQPIGYVGNSGNAEGTSPHLHFEIRPGGGSAVI